MDQAWTVAEHYPSNRTLVPHPQVNWCLIHELSMEIVNFESFWMGSHCKSLVIHMQHSQPSLRQGERDFQIFLFFPIFTNFLKSQPPLFFFFFGLDFFYTFLIFSVFFFCFLLVVILLWKMYWIYFNQE